MHEQPIAFQPPTEDAAPILLPVGSHCFADRAARFARLAEGHSLADWLAFLGRVSAVQQAALDALPELPLPDAAQMERARAHAMPPLDPTQRPAAWRDVLRRLAGDLLAGDGLPEPTRQALQALCDAADSALETLADQLISGDMGAADAARLPFVAAALQVVYTGLAGRLGEAHVAKLDAHGLCPCCGSPPVASIVRLGSAINNLRYLHCSLCNTEWNVPRAVCTACGSDKGLALHELKDASRPVRAESCDACQGYLKIVYQDKDPLVDPVADDLATLALDMLVDEAGFGRAGPNLLLIGAHSG